MSSQLGGERSERCDRARWIRGVVDNIRGLMLAGWTKGVCVPMERGHLCLGPNDTRFKPILQRTKPKQRARTSIDPGSESPCVPYTTSGYLLGSSILGYIKFSAPAGAMKTQQGCFGAQKYIGRGVERLVLSRMRWIHPTLDKSMRSDGVGLVAGEARSRGGLVDSTSCAARRYASYAGWTHGASKTLAARGDQCRRCRLFRLADSGSARHSLFCPDSSIDHKPSSTIARGRRKQKQQSIQPMTQLGKGRGEALVSDDNMHACARLVRFTRQRYLSQQPGANTLGVHDSEVWGGGRSGAGEISARRGHARTQRSRAVSALPWRRELLAQTHLSRDMRRVQADFRVKPMRGVSRAVDSDVRGERHGAMWRSLECARTWTLMGYDAGRGRVICEDGAASWRLGGWDAALAGAGLRMRWVYEVGAHGAKRGDGFARWTQCLWAYIRVDVVSGTFTPVWADLRGGVCDADSVAGDVRVHTQCWRIVHTRGPAGGGKVYR
ncbi:hypothetical protein B0H13DRAFT_2429776 [Mycena leptocephala]|nr:hypothetical protein B0H13DRAFT_2429776 [Mycena leptocephala]